MQPFYTSKRNCQATENFVFVTETSNDKKIIQGIIPSIQGNPLSTRIPEDEVCFGHSLLPSLRDLDFVSHFNGYLLYKHNY